MVVFLGGLSAIAPLAIDMGLPAFASTAAALGVQAGDMAHSLSLFLLGFSLGPLVVGPLADRFGRRPMLIAGLLVFIAGGLGTAIAGEFNGMLWWRTVQGVGSGVAATLPFAIARDLYQGDEARVRLSFMTLVLGVGPILAPVLGAVALHLGGWRAIYGTLAAGGLLFLVVTSIGFRESAPVARVPLTLHGVVGSYRFVLGHRQFVGNALVNACGFGVMFAYISGSPAVLMGNLGLNGFEYSLVFAITASILMSGSFANGRLARRGMPSSPIVVWSSRLIVLASFALVALALLGRVSAPGLTVCVGLALFGFGMLAPNVTHDALEPMGNRAGVATAVLRAIQMAAAALSSALVGAFHDGETAMSLALVMAGFAVAAVLFHRVARSGREV